MTKIMAKIVEKYEEKMDMELWLCSEGFNEPDVALDNIDNECKIFRDLRSSMFSYGLISEKDFDETTHTASNIWYKYMYAIHRLK